MASVAYPHIETTESGVPLVAGTRTKIVEIVLDHLAHHWDAEEIQRQHPHLSLAQIYSALAYYHDHRAEVDRDIAERLNKAEMIAIEQPASIIREKLRSLGKLP
ncbi:MAG: DUF433 domain-containing protein [Planctomycetota bacterium]